MFGVDAMLSGQKALAILIFCVGCAATPEHKNRLDWLEVESPIIAVDIDWRPKPPVLESSKSRAGESAARGAAEGAADSALEVAVASRDMWYGSCSGDFCGIEILLRPVLIVAGAVAGAVVGGASGAGNAENVVNYYDVRDIKGANALFELAQNEISPSNLLRDQIILHIKNFDHAKVINKSKKSVIKSDEQKKADVYVKASVLRFSLIGHMQEDPPVSLVLSGQTLIDATKSGAQFACFWHYEGPTRKMSEMVAGEAHQFKIDLTTAANEIAKVNAANLKRGECDDKDLDQIAKSPYFFSGVPSENRDELQAKLWWRSHLDPSNQQFTTRFKRYIETRKLAPIRYIVMNRTVVKSVDLLYTSKERAFVNIAFSSGNPRYMQSTEYKTVLFEVIRFGRYVNFINHGEEAARSLQIFRDSQ
jgi:hypothetical protein